MGFKLKIGDTYKSKAEASVVDEVDVLVAGGGTAGLTKYIVHEKSQSEYRKVVAELATNPSSVQVVGGIPMEITKRLLDMKAAVGTDGTAGSYVFTSSEDFKWLLLTMVEEAGVKLLLHSLIVGVIKEDNTVKGIIVENKSGRQAILADIFVDTTGDGDVAARSGVPFVVGAGPEDLSAKAGIPLQRMQPMGVMFRVGNVDMERCFEYLKIHPDKFRVQNFALMGLDEAYESFKKGEMMTIEITVIDQIFQIYNTPLSGVFIFCCPCYSGNGLSVKDLTQGEISLVKEVRKQVADMKKVLPGFENAYWLDCPQICVRETRHIKGEYKLNIEDIYSSRKFKDTIGKGCHPIDIEPIPETIKKRSLSRWYFNIPYRCLVPKQIDNMLVAGRCISATREASGCTRATVQCMVTGEATGTAAAMCVKQNVKPRDLNIDELRKKLIDEGVVL